MIALNLDKKTGRVLCAYEIPSGIYPEGTQFVDALPDGVLYEYRYVNGEFIHDPIKEEPAEQTASIAVQSINVEPSDADRILALEEKINQLQELVNTLTSKS